jgi:hypothetical protein
LDGNEGPDGVKGDFGEFRLAGAMLVANVLGPML